MSYELIESERGGIMFQKGKPKFIEAASKSRKKEIQMNGIIKKLAVIVMLAAMAIFMAMATASAWWPFRNAISGQFAVTGFSSCNPDSPGIMEADYTFRIDGTGSISGFGRSIPESPMAFVALRADFHYTVTKEGRIEFQYPWPPGGLKVGSVDEFGIFTPFVTMNAGPSHGVISPDGNTITISCGPPVLLWAINDQGQHVGDPVWCVTTLSGMRIR
jgi:hypothetical protein